MKVILKVPSTVQIAHFYTFRIFENRRIENYNNEEVLLI